MRTRNTPLSRRSAFDKTLDTDSQRLRGRVHNTNLGRRNRRGHDTGHPVQNVSPPEHLENLRASLQAAPIGVCNYRIFLIEMIELLVVWPRPHVKNSGRDKSSQDPNGPFPTNLSQVLRQRVCYKSKNVSLIPVNTYSMKLSYQVVSIRDSINCVLIISKSL